MFATEFEFVPLKDGIEVDGGRIVRLVAKGKNRPVNLQESLAVTVPVVTPETITEHIEALLPFVIGYVQSVQDTMIRDIRVDTGADSISMDQIAMPAVLQYLAANASSERLTAELIRTWLADEYAEHILDWIKSRPGMDGIADIELGKKYNAISGVFETFADARSKLARPVLNMVITLCSDLNDVADGRMLLIAAKARQQLDKLDAGKDALDGLI